MSVRIVQPDWSQSLIKPADGWPEGLISKPLENTRLVGLVSDLDEPTLRQQDPNSSE